MNNQKQESKIESDGSILEVHSIFKTIQGEGPFSGTPAIFIRLAGCNLQCPGCDTDYTSMRANASYLTMVNDVIKLAEDTIKLVVITGGEPFRQNIEPLIELLVDQDYFVQIETNGTIKIPTPDWLWNTDINQRKGRFIICSPKTPKIDSDIEKYVCAFKYVLNHNHIADDGLPSNVLGLKGTSVARPSEDFKGLIYLSPEDTFSAGTRNKNIQACIDSSLKNGYIMCIQLHKYLNLK